MKARFNKSLFLVCAISILMCSVIGALANVGYGKKGDVDNNGVIESMDYILAKRAYFGTFRLEGNAVKRADINNNGEIDSMDYILVKRAYFGTYIIKNESVEQSTNDEAKPHVCKYDITETVKATCTEQGYVLYMCSCGEIGRSEILTKTAHKMGAWKVIKEATVTTEGKKQRKCKNCSYTETIKIEKIIDESVYEAVLTNENTDLLEERIRYYLNKYRVEEGKCEMAMLDGKARLFAQGRGEQLLYNFAHDTDERRQLATELEFGKYVPEHPETIFNFETNKVEYTGGTVPAYYEPYGGEAIGKCVTTNSTIDRIALRLATACRESSAHWNYVGDNDSVNVAIGASVSYDDLVCVCVGYGRFKLL